MQQLDYKTAEALKKHNFINAYGGGIPNQNLSISIVDISNDIPIQASGGVQDNK